MTRKSLFGLALAFAWACHASGQSWVAANAPLANWSDVAYSTNADRLFAVSSGGGIYVSTNWGFDWTLTSAPTTNWDSVACSANGQKVFATVYGGSLYLSTDAGATWQQSSAPAGTWTSVACSSDGAKVIAAQGDFATGPNAPEGYLYLSTNSGATWSTSNSVYNSWEEVTCSADGTILFAKTPESFWTYRSTNSGVTWDQFEDQAAGSFVISQDGQRLSGLGQGLYVSTNSGDSGVFLDLPPTVVGYLGGSGDGLGLLAAEVCGPLYTSDDGGTNWALAPSLGSTSGWALGASPDGAWRIAMAQEGSVWISYVPDSAPFFVQQPPASTVAEQSTTIQLQAPVLGSTPMYLQWQCNGTNLVDSDRVDGTTNVTLTISDLQLSDAGVYTLVATNPFGSALSQPAQLTVTPDLQKPMLAVYFPTNGQRATGESFQIEGSATDSVQVAGVWFQLNSGPWCLATTNYGSWLNWSGNLPVVPGTNTLRCYAIDLAGNCSVTNNISFTPIIVSLATITQNGPGRIRPDYNGQLLKVGTNYTTRAEPPQGYIFAGWTGDIQSMQQKLTFTMQSNLVLQANYVTNPFPPLAGRYSGEASGELQPIVTGPILFTAVVGGKGAFAARLTLGKQVFHCSGQLSPTGYANISFSGPADFQPNGGTLQLDLSGSGGLRGEFASEGVYSGILEVDAARK